MLAALLIAHIYISDTRLAMPVYSGNEVAKVKFNLARKN